MCIEKYMRINGNSNLPRSRLTVRIAVFDISFATSSNIFVALAFIIESNRI